VNDKSEVKHGLLITAQICPDMNSQEKCKELYLVVTDGTHSLSAGISSLYLPSIYAVYVIHVEAVYVMPFIGCNF